MLTFFLIFSSLLKPSFTFMLIYDEFCRMSLVSGLNCDELDKASLYYGPHIHYYKFVTFYENITEKSS